MSMCYTYLFNFLFEKADDVYGWSLPIRMRCLIDECASINQIPKLEKIIATIHSRKISTCLVLQIQSQVKAIYKDAANIIIDNCDTSLFSDSKEPTPLKKPAVVLSKETTDTYNNSKNRSPGSHDRKLLAQIVCKKILKTGRIMVYGTLLHG